MNRIKKVVDPWSMAILKAFAVSLFLSSAAFGQGAHAGLGLVASASHTTQNGIVLVGGATIFDKDLLTTGRSGRAQIVFWPSSKVTLNENTSLVVTSVIDQVRLELRQGNIVVEGSRQNLVVIDTPRFEIQPPREGISKVYVGFMGDNSTYVESAKGDTVIVDNNSGDSYLLPAGKNTLVAANSKGIPGLQVRTQSAKAAGTPAPTKPEVPSSEAQMPSQPRIKQSHSHETGVLLGVLAAAGAAGGIAAASGGGNNVAAPPPALSPSKP